MLAEGLRSSPWLLIAMPMFVSEGTSLLSCSVRSLLRACLVDDEILLVSANLSGCCRDESLFQFVFSEECALQVSQKDRSSILKGPSCFHVRCVFLSRTFSPDAEMLLVLANLSGCCRQESQLQCVLFVEFGCPCVPIALVIVGVCRCVAVACFA